MRDDNKTSVMSNEVMCEYYAAWLALESLNVLNWVHFGGSDTPLGSVEKEILYNIGQIYQALQRFIPILQDTIKQECELIYKYKPPGVPLQRLQTQNAFVLSLSLMDEYLGHAAYQEELEVMSEEQIKLSTEDYKQTALRHMLIQFDPVTIRRVLKELEQDNLLTP